MNPDSIFAPRLSMLEQALRAAGIDLFIQPVSDEFQGEYVPAHAARLTYVSGFTGSAGLGAFWAAPDTARRHVLFTDGRYTIQAARELAGSGITPINSGEQSLGHWLSAKADAPLRIGFDPWLISHAQLQAWQRTTVQASLEWVPIPNPIDAIWADQPGTPASAVRLHPTMHSGASFAEKRSVLLDLFARHGADACVLTLPDGINWLTNLRGSDIPFNPLLLGYAILRQSGTLTLYHYPRDFDPELRAYFVEQTIETAPLDAILNFTAAPLPNGARVLIDPSSAAQGWWQWAERAGWELIAIDDPTLLPKACKNTIELDGMRAAHQRDGVALSKFLCWFDAQVDRKQYPDELTVVRVLEEFRARDNRYRGASFATIAGAGEHGAIVHYRADAMSNRPVRRGELFLLDSGGQYDDGTTDVTRTLAVGEPSAAMREHFTRVLKGHIALASAVFPVGTGGIQLDALARQYLWQAGLDYDHGTGHGVGAFLCVHEGPQRISKKGSAVPLQPGMILSNEPGYYEAGSHGIRIENLVAVVEHKPGWRAFETLTLAPIDTRLVALELLSSDERNWLNAYHRNVCSALEPLMESAEKAWLYRATRAI